MSRINSHCLAQFDVQPNESKVVKRRPKQTGPVGPVGPLRHWSVQSLFSRTRTSSVGPTTDRVASVVAYRHTTTDNDKVKAKVNVNAKVTKHCDQNKSAAVEQCTVQLRSDIFSLFFDNLCEKDEKQRQVRPCQELLRSRKSVCLFVC